MIKMQEKIFINNFLREKTNTPKPTSIKLDVFSSTNEVGFRELQAKLVENHLEHKNDIYITKAITDDSQVVLKRNMYNDAVELAGLFSCSSTARSELFQIIQWALQNKEKHNHETWQIFLVSSTGKKTEFQSMTFEKDFIDDRWNFGLFKWGDKKIQIKYALYEFRHLDK